MGIFKMGMINLLLSDLLVSGYTTATAILVMATQFSVLFGLSIQIVPVSTIFPGLLSFPRVRSTVLSFQLCACFINSVIY